jgi:hypothetical protein
LSSSESADEGIAERCRSKADTSDVIRAAEDPKPVLCTSGNLTPVELKGVISDREARVRGRLKEAS